MALDANPPLFFWDIGNKCPQPHSVPALGQAPPPILPFPNPPSFTDLLQGQSGSFQEPELRIPTPIRAPAQLKKGFCFVFMSSREKAELARAHLMCPKSAPEGLPWLKHHLPLAFPAPLSSQEPAGEVVVASLELLFHRMSLWLMENRAAKLCPDHLQVLHQVQGQECGVFYKTN